MVLLVKEYILDNNLTVVYECLSHMNSVSFGVWIGVGSRNETRHNNGISHFIEHMLFKGTRSRTAKDIAYAIDKIGGEINAFTAKDCTCFYTKTLDSDLETAVELLSDMILNPEFNQAHIETEKKVVLEEISMYEDDPEEYVHDLLTEEMWSDGPLGYPVLGTAESLNNITRNDLFEHMSYFYIPDNCVISVVGNFNESHLIEIISKYFGNWKSIGYCRLPETKPDVRANFLYQKKDTEQTHICLGLRGLPMSDERIYALMVLNNIIGGGMSSRLFQKLREDCGLVYSVYSYPTMFRDCGMFTIYAAAKPEKAEEVIRITGLELKNLVEKGISDNELMISKNQFKGNYILSLDNTAGRMSIYGKSKIITGIVNTPDTVLKKIDNVSKNNITDLLRWIFTEGKSGAVILGESPVSADTLEFLKF